MHACICWYTDHHCITPRYHSVLIRYLGISTSATKRPFFLVITGYRDIEPSHPPSLDIYSFHSIFSSKMRPNSHTPVVIGVGDIKNQSPSLSSALEPMKLMSHAIQLALADTSLPPHVLQTLQAEIDSLDVVATWTWPYADLPGALSSELGINPKHKHYSEYHGGNQPAKLFDDAARRISRGESRVAIVTGGEALASCMCSLICLEA